MKLRKSAVAVLLLLSLASGTVTATEPEAAQNATEPAQNPNLNPTTRGLVTLSGESPEWRSASRRIPANQSTRLALWEAAYHRDRLSDRLLSSMREYRRFARYRGRLIAKSRYHKAVANGEPGPVAQELAIKALADYYARLQVVLLSDYEAGVQLTTQITETARQEGIADPTLTERLRESGQDSVNQPTAKTGTVDVSLINNSKYSVTTYQTSNGHLTNPLDWNWPADGSGPRLVHVVVVGPDDLPSDQRVRLVRSNKYVATNGLLTRQYRSQRDRLRDTLDAPEEWRQSGIPRINISKQDIRYDPQTQTIAWGLRTLPTLGVRPPSDISNIRNMSVTDHETSRTLNGIMMVENVSEAGYPIGLTRGDSNGSELILTNSGVEELNGQFTIDRVTKIEESNESGLRNDQYPTVEYPTVDRYATSTGEYQQKSTQLVTMQSKINAHIVQTTTQLTGPMPGLLSPSQRRGLPAGSIPAAVVVAAVALLGLVAKVVK